MEGGESNSNKGLNGKMLMQSQNPIIKIQSKIKELENGFQFKIKELENRFQFKIKELENGFQFKKEKLKLLGADGKMPVVIKAASDIIIAANSGYLLGYLVRLGNKFAKKHMPSLVSFPEQLFSGGPIVQACNFASAAAVHSSIMCMLEGSNEKYALKSAMIAGLGAGAMFSLVNGMGGSGTISIKNMLATGLLFAVLNGGVHMFSEVFSNVIMKNSVYTETRSMLMNLGLQHYESNFQRALLDDTILPFLTNSALKDANIAPGSRLRILNHIERDRVAGQNQRK